MKKKAMIFLGILILISVGLFVYFRPIPLSNRIHEDNPILITVNELGTRNGEAYMDLTDYKDITDKQKSDILSLLKNYSYRRTWGTLFSDGSMSGLGDKLLYIFVYDENTLIDTISISSTGEIAVDDKTYKIENAAHLMEELVEICS